MNSYLAISGIRFNDCLFTEPTQLASWITPKYAGIFVILASDLNWAPKPLRALYFGEFGNNAQEVLPASDRDRIRLAGATRGESLLVSALPMPFSTTAQRSEICNQLVWAYNPVWQANAAPPASSELTRKLEELEKKHEEQTTQLRLLLASVNRLFEPLPEPPPRRIGFLPQPVTAL
jgi:hypothetical protein